jgi:acetyl esterase/lipase
MTNRHHAWAAAAVLAVIVAGSAAAQPQKQPAKLPEGVELLRDVQYGMGGGRPLKMHILRPKTAPRELMPVVVWIHGGGWQAGNKDSGIRLLAPFAGRGYFCASIEYRLSGEAKFPAQIEDCKCAIRFLRAKAKQFHLDPDRIGVWGASAGGHLVALLGTSAYVKELEGQGGWPEYSSRVQAVCDFCGPTDLARLAAKSKNANNPITKLLGGPPAEHKKMADLANPITHVTKDAPPFLIVHGDEDTTVLPAQSEMLRDTLKKVGVPVTLHVAVGQGHGLGGAEITRVVQEFFDRHLKAGGGKTGASLGN